MKQKKNSTWESLDDIEVRIKDAQKSINNWIFFIALEIGTAIVAIVVKMTPSTTPDKSGDSAANVPSLYEMAEGKKIDTGKVAGAVAEKMKDNLSPGDIMETISSMPHLKTFVIIFVATLLMLGWKIIKKKSVQQEFEDKKKETRGQSLTF